MVQGYAENVGVISYQRSSEMKRNTAKWLANIVLVFCAIAAYLIVKELVERGT